VQLEKGKSEGRGTSGIDRCPPSTPRPLSPLPAALSGLAQLGVERKAAEYVGGRGGIIEDYGYSYLRQKN